MDTQNQILTQTDLLSDLGYPIVDGLPTTLMNSSDTLPSSANLAILLVLLVACLTGFHLLLVKRLRLSNRAWKYVDYIWLPLAIVGLLGSITSVRAALAETALKLDPSERLLLFWISRESRTTYDKLNCAHIGDATKEIGATADTYIPSYCLWLLQLEFATSDEAVEHFYVKLKDRTVLPAPPSNSEGLIGYQSLSRMRVRLIELTSIRLDNYKRLKIPSFVAGLVTLGPLLLVVALALRITRVSGELANEYRLK